MKLKEKLEKKTVPRLKADCISLVYIQIAFVFLFCFLLNYKLYPEIAESSGRYRSQTLFLTGSGLALLAYHQLWYRVLWEKIESRDFWLLSNYCLVIITQLLITSLLLISVALFL